MEELELHICYFYYDEKNNKRLSNRLDKRLFDIVTKDKQNMKIDYSVTLFDTNPISRLRKIIKVVDNKKIPVILMEKQQIFIQTDKKRKVPYKIIKSIETIKNDMGITFNVGRLRFRKRYYYKDPKSLFSYEFGEIYETDNTKSEAITMFNKNPESVFVKYKQYYDFEIESIVITNDSIRELIDLSIIEFIKMGISWIRDVNVYKIYQSISSKIDIESEHIAFTNFVNRPITLERSDMFNLYDCNYTVTDKADGDNVLIIFTGGFIHIILSSEKCVVSQKFDTQENKTTILVGEYIHAGKEDINAGSIKQTKKKYTKINVDLNGVIYCYDIYMINNVSMLQSQLKDRLQKLNNFIDNIDLKCFQVKKFYNSIKDVTSIINQTETTKKLMYDIDGVIFTPSDTYKDSIIYKWKPINKLSADFYVKRYNGNVYLYATAGDKIGYTLNKINKKHKKISSILINSKQLVLFVVFNGDEESMDTYLTTDIPDGIDEQVVEFIWKNDSWSFLRLRKDKMFPNVYTTILSVYNAIKYPISVKDFKDPTPSNYEKLKSNNDYGYWAGVRSGTDLVMMKSFHNTIKDKYYKKYCKKGSSIIDIGGGHANDVHKWISTGISNVIIIENDIDAINEGKKRYQELVSKDKNIIDIEFVRNDVNKREDPISLDVEVDCIVCHFAIHYFMENIDYIYKFLQNHLKYGGKFIFTTFDKSMVLKLFEKCDSVGNFGHECVIGKRKFVIVKLKDQDKIGVYVNSIGTYNEEYLVDIDKIKKIFKKFKMIEKIGFKDIDIDSKNKMPSFEKTYSNLNMICVFENSSE